MLYENFTLLYVEDDKEVSETLSEILELSVKELYVAENGREGLELFHSKSPDIILTDINMPEMNGIEMSKEIKKIKPHQPIIILTAFNDLDHLHQAVNLGIDKYLNKPIVNINLLYDALESLAKVLQSDIEIKELQQMLQMQSKLAAIGDMIGNIAHQWRQPLTVISSSAGNLNMSMELGSKLTNEDVMKHLNTVTDQADYLTQTIADFRNFVDNSNSQKNPFSIKEALEKLINMTQDAFEQKGIKVICTIEDVTIVENENQLIQALLNIFNNVVDAFHHAQVSDKRYMFINCTAKEKDISLTIKDSAGGIKDDLTQKIFEPYYTTKHQSVGTGISLYMTHKIITKYLSGTIMASNSSYCYKDKEYTGALFTVKLQR